MAGLRGLRHPRLHDIRGRGLLVGLEVTAGTDTHALSEAFLAEGILTKETRRHTFRLAPPLIIDAADGGRDRAARGPGAGETAVRLLMCAPEHFDVTYEINAWMRIVDRPDRHAAWRQWRALYALLTDTLGADVVPDSAPDRACPTWSSRRTRASSVAGRSSRPASGSPNVRAR